MTEIKHEYGSWIVYINGNPKFSFTYKDEAQAVADMVDALVDLLKIAKWEKWHQSSTGRQIIYRNAEETLRNMGVDMENMEGKE